MTFKSSLKPAFKKTLVASALTTLLYAAAPTMAAESFGGVVKGYITNTNDLALSDAKVTLKHQDKGLVRTITTNKKGHFVLPKLPIGRYTMTITKNGYNTVTEQDIEVKVGNSVVYNAPLYKVSEDMEVISVRGSAISRIDTSSSTGGITVTAQELSLMPIEDGFAAMSLLSPGVSGSSSFDSNSIGGASSAENGYYLNGLNVTNIRKGMGEIDLPFEAIAQTQIKSGGIDPEFGGALGGVINAISKSGGNDFDFGAQARIDPSGMLHPHQNLTRLDGTTLENTRNDDSEYTELRVWGSGPIIEDKLFAYVLIQPEREEFEERGVFSAANGDEETDSWFAKVDWIIAENHTLEFTGIGFETERDGKTYEYDFDANGNTLGDYLTDFKTKTGGDVFGAKYTGYLSDEVSLDIIAGRTTEQDYSSALDSLPGVWDERGESRVTLSNHTASSIEDGKYTRDQLRADLSWELEDHSLKFGIDHYKIDVDYTFVQNGEGDARGWWSVYTATSDDFSQQAPGTDFIEQRIRGRFVNSEVKSTAIYVQDSWQVTDDLVLNLGARYSDQSNTVSGGDKYVDITGQFAPRLQATYDLSGDGSKKVFFTYGRYFQPVSANMNITQGSAQRETFDYYALNDVNADGTPVLLPDGSPSRGELLRDQRVRQQGITEPGLIASSNLKGMYSDEFTLGYEQEVFDGDMSAGVRFVYRDLGMSLEDTDIAPVLAKKLAEMGIEDNVGQDSYYVLYNPGESVQMAYDFDGDGNVDNITLTKDELQIPDPERTYTALEFTLRGKVTDKMQINASYVWSHSWGMTEGLVKSDTNRAAPGWTTSYDYADLMDHGAGNLPNDRRHSFKIAGTYALTDDLTLGWHSRIASGTPINKFGIHPKGVDSCAEGSPWEDCISFFYGALSFYDWQGNPAPRGSAGRTPWTAELDLSLSYQMQLGDGNLTLSAKVYNVFNASTATQVNQENALWDDDQIVANPEWNRTTRRLDPRYMALTARYTF